ncbi:MAG: RNA 2',3'-cyclic phosphodiesterase [archaeon]|nr:RNA 2',3'-cyclic phosphodiesterase [archaeon]
MRSFLALDVGDERTVRLIEEVQDKLRKTEADIKLVEPNNLHFTVKFFGEINEALTTKIINSLKSVRFRPLHIAYKGMGVFPSPRRVSVIWVGVEKSCRDDLFNVANTVEERLKGLVRSDRRGFQPHVTISRVKSGKNRDRLLDVIKEYESQAFGEETIMSLKLKKSDLTPKGPIYSDVHTFQFGVD